MNLSYEDIPDKLIYDNLTNLIGQVFKLLPYKENDVPTLDEHLSNILLRLTGLTTLTQDSPELITVISVLEAIRSEDNFQLFRKAVLDSCSTLQKLQEKYHVGTVQA